MNMLVIIGFTICLLAGFIIGLLNKKKKKPAAERNEQESIEHFTATQDPEGDMFYFHEGELKRIPHGNANKRKGSH